MSVTYTCATHRFLMVRLLNKLAVSRKTNSADFCFTSVILLLDNEYGYLTLSQTLIVVIDKYCKV